jgi:uncharacterized membrane protein
MESSPQQSPVQTDGLALKIDRALYFFTKHWLAFFNTAVFIYVFLPILAPILMNAGATGPAKVIYTIYSPMCHQMATRSFFLFGEQPVYPRALAGTNYQPLEAYADQLPEFEGVPEENWAQFFLAARRFVGNEQMGYKMALCERDMAIYGFVLVFGLIYALLRHRVRIRPLPVLVFILIGMVPIALDGFSQLFGYYATPIDGSTPGDIQATLSQIFALRESPPWMRTATGALFGFMLGWLIYPHIEVGMKSSEQDLARKLGKE